MTTENFVMPLLPGVPDFYSNIECFCFRYDATFLANELVRAFGYEVVGDGMNPQRIEVTPHTLRVVQYKGCEWSCILPVTASCARELRGLDVTSAVSARLEIAALYLGISDTAGGAAYRYVCSGERVEEFVFSVEDQESQFFSTQRQVDVRHLGYEDVDAIVRDLGITPPLFWSPFESVGSSVTPQQEIDPYWEQVKEVLILERRANR